MANLCFSAFTADGTSHGDDQKGQFSLDASTDSQLVVGFVTHCARAEPRL